MSCKLVLNISSKDRSIDWPAVAISVRNCLAEKSRANLERVCIIPADKFMTILPVGNYEGTMCEENLLEDFDILVAIGQNSDAMLRKLAKERGIALISLAIDNFDSLNLNCAPTGGFVTSLLTRDERERIERISEGVLVILIAEGILKLINLIF